MDLFEELQIKTQELDKSIKSLRHTGTEYAEAERSYKVALRQEALRLRASDMAVTLIDKVVYGTPEVSEKRLLRDIAKAVYQANLEAINSIKLQIRILDAQITREMGN